MDSFTTKKRSRNTMENANCEDELRRHKEKRYVTDGYKSVDP